MNIVNKHSITALIEEHGSDQKVNIKEWGNIFNGTSLDDFLFFYNGKKLTVDLIKVPVCQGENNE